jgi:hypothetical protein
MAAKLNKPTVGSSNRCEKKNSMKENIQRGIRVQRWTKNGQVEGQNKHCEAATFL